MIRLPRQTDSLLKNKVVLTIRCEGKGKQSAMQEQLFALLGNTTKWKPGCSRAIIFVTSRAKAEELAQSINEAKIAAGGKCLVAEAFHAGLSTETKSVVYDCFLAQGAHSIDVLCATKAFGMGMDIDNIHLVIHFGPPDSLEDYVQEIGRAARSEKSLRQAGLSQATAVLLYTKTDFEDMRTRIQQDSLSAMDLQSLLAAIQSEFVTLGKTLPVRGILEAEKLTKSVDGLKANKVRTGLYWLERLGRIELGCYIAGQITLEVQERRRLEAVRPSLSPAAQKLLDFLALRAGQTKQNIAIPTAATRTQLGFQNNEQLFRSLAELAHHDAIVGRKLYLPLPRRDYERRQECLACLPDQSWPLLNAALCVLETYFAPLLNCARQDEFHLPAAELTNLLAEPLEQSLYHWLDSEGRARRAEFDQKRLKDRGHAVVRLAEGFGICYVKEQLQNRCVTYLVRARHRNWQTRLRLLSKLIRDLLSLIIQAQKPEDVASSQSKAIQTRTIQTSNRDRGTSPVSKPGEISSLLLLHQLEHDNPEVPLSPRMVEAMLRFLRSLGYIDRFDTFLPLAYEASLLSEAELNVEEPSIEDAQVLAELKDQAQLRVWRLAALEAAVCIAEQADVLEEFLTLYFRSDSVALLQQGLEALKARNPNSYLTKIVDKARTDAFFEVFKLSDLQRHVCVARADRDLLINAGPGAGKTKTLLARLTYLIHEMGVSPEKILVLAFTRAVVDELRLRLRESFSQLGYSSSYVQGVAVRTFHSFALNELRGSYKEADAEQEEEKGKEKEKNIDQPISFLVNMLVQNDGLRLALSQRYQYIFVDEFQDVYEARYDLLKLLAGASHPQQQPPAGRKVQFVVALDDDQSIYDYKIGRDTDDPRRCLNDFRSWAHLEEHVLTLNYRSAVSIVEASQDIVLTQLKDRLKDEKKDRLQPVRSERGAFYRHDLVEEPVDLAAVVIDQVRAVAAELAERRVRGTGSRASKTIAILTPTNEDVYRIKRQLQKAFGSDFTYLVQGAESSFYLRRDVARIRDKLLGDELRERPITAEVLLDWLDDQLRKQPYLYWPGQTQQPKRNELWYLAEDFVPHASPSATFGDFAEYLYDVSRHGNYLQIVAKRQAADEAAPVRILLSTIHKVKGLEFPAVILPSSEAHIDRDEIENALRVLYVGMTRAEDTLVFICGPRESHMLQRHEYKPVQPYRQGIPVKPSLKDVFISYYGFKSYRVCLIDNELMMGRELDLVKNDYSYEIHLSNSARFFGKLAEAKPGRLAHRLQAAFPDVPRLSGLEVAGIYRWDADQDKKLLKQDGSSFFDGLADEVKARGYYHVVEICGLVQPAR